MPKNIKITGDDPQWKRAVDELLVQLQQQIAQMQKDIKTLKGLK